MKIIPLLLTLSLLSPTLILHADSSSVENDIISMESLQSEDVELINKFNKLSISKQQLLTFILIRNKKYKNLQLILGSGFDVNYLYKGTSPLHAAIALDNIETLKILVKNNANLELKDENKEPPLKSAVRKDNIKVIEYLINQGADVNISGKNNTSPLTTAAFKGNKKVIELLVKKGADINVKQSKTNWNLLHYAANYNHPHLIDYLIEKGIKVDSRSKKGFSPLAIASSEGYLKVVEKLLKHLPDIELPTIKHKNTPLLLAAAYGHTGVVSRLLEAGADIEYINKNKHDALWFAAVDSHSETVKLLLEKVGDRNKVFFKATHKGDFEVVRTLLKAGVDVHARTEKGSTALHMAARYGHLNIVKLLHKHGADIHAVATKKKDTPLMRAAGWGKKDVLKYLIEQGAEVDIKSQAGWTAALSTARHHSLKTLKLLIENGADIHQATNNGWTILMVAIKGKKKNTIEYLLKQDLDLELKNKKGQTALDIAIKFKDEQIIEMIKKAKTDQTIISKA